MARSHILPFGNHETKCHAYLDKYICARAREYLNPGTRLYFCMVGKFLIDMQSWVRIFLAATCEPGLTARAFRPRGMRYRGGFNKRKLCPGQRNPPASASLWRWQGGFLCPWPYNNGDRVNANYLHGWVVIIQGLNNNPKRGKL